jgi:hypothetical protein
MCFNANTMLVNRVDLAPLSMSSQPATGLSALAPAQRAGAQRLRAFALSDVLHRQPDLGRTEHSGNWQTAECCRGDARDPMDLVLDIKTRKVNGS